MKITINMNFEGSFTFPEKFKSVIKTRLNKFLA